MHLMRIADFAERFGLSSGAMHLFHLPSGSCNFLERECRERERECERYASRGISATGPPNVNCFGRELTTAALLRQSLRKSLW